MFGLLDCSRVLNSSFIGILFIFGLVGVGSGGHVVEGLC